MRRLGSPRWPLALCVLKLRAAQLLAGSTTFPSVSHFAFRVLAPNNNSELINGRVVGLVVTRAGQDYGQDL